MISIIIVNYNVPENTDSLVEYIHENIKIEYKLHVIDNGSDDEFISKYTTTRLETNRNKMGGLLTGLCMASRDIPEAYWTISTNMQLIPTELDIGYELLKELKSDERIVAVSPYWAGELVEWTHTIFKRKDGCISHKTKQVGPFAMFDSVWLDSIGWFDPCLTGTWGADFELKYIAEKQSKIFKIHDLVGYEITKSKVTKLNRSNTDLSSYQKECNDEMERVMKRKYGENWRDVLGAYDD